MFAKITRKGYEPHPPGLAAGAEAVRAVIGAMTRICELEEDGPLLHGFGRSFALAIGLAACTLGSMLLTLRGGGLVDLGPVQPLWAVVRWLVVIFLLWLAVALL